MRRWKVWMLVVGVTAVAGLLLFTTGAGAATRKAVPRLWGGGGGACRSLMGDPAAIKDMQALRAEHLKDMQAWSQKYGSDPTSSAAQQALAQLRQEHWNDMQQLFKKYGIKAPAAGAAGSVSPYGPGMMGGGYGGGCWRNGASSQSGTSGSASPGAATTYGPGMMGGGYGGMMGQSL